MTISPALATVGHVTVAPAPRRAQSAKAPRLYASAGVKSWLCGGPMPGGENVPTRVIEGWAAGWHLW